jgi:hypothetical protein
MDDDELLTLLGESLGRDLTVSARATEAARGAYAWLRVEEELADLVFDSADEPELAGARGGPAVARQIMYQGGETTVECELDADGLVGEVLPPGPARVWRRSPGSGDTELDVDEHGRFTDAPPPAEPFSLRVARVGQPQVSTPWLLP